ncbi:MAG: FtsX-like permease family protein [Gemmatimonadota bacterium]|nr:FtsX-like permease family protein [Gemmatimonadota bacterium]
MIRYLLRTLNTRWRTGKSLLILSWFGVTLGVASVLSIQILNRSAFAAFQGGVTAISGRADLSVTGMTPRFADSLYLVVIADPDVARAWPLLQTSVIAEASRKVVLDLYGVDLFQPTGLPLEEMSGEIGAPLTDGWVAITPAFATEHGLSVGDTLMVSSGILRVPLRIGALVNLQRLTPAANRTMAIMDIAQAQGLFGASGLLTQIDIGLAEGADPATAQARIQETLGPGVTVATPAERAQQGSDLLAAFRLNLTALSSISLLVGLFLVYASTQASLVRRRKELGLLLSIGASRGQVLGLILAEIAVVGGLGVTIGLPLGYWIASANVSSVSATIVNLYQLNAIETLALPWTMYALAVVVGLGGAILGALWPALEISRRPSHELLAPFTLHQSLRSAAGAMFVAGITIFVLSGGWYFAFGRAWRPAGFVLAMALMVGLALLAPATLDAVARPLVVRRLGLAYSVKTLAARLQTSAVAVASLGLVVSMLVGVTFMVGSFRETVAVWIEGTVHADIYITTESWARSGDDAALNDSTIQFITSRPEVQAFDRLRATSATIGGRRTFVAGVDLSQELPDRFAFLRGDPVRATRLVRDSGAVLISEPLARRMNSWVGDTIRVPGRVEAAFVVAGVYYDYGNEAGAVVMDLGTMAGLIGPGPVSNLALYLKDGLAADNLVNALRSEMGALPLQIRSNLALRTEVLQIFDRTFAITAVVQALSLIIAVAGVTLTLLVLARERVAELALYQALGASRRQIFGIFLGKGFTIAALGLVLGLAGGVVLAAILIYVINRDYFGWTIQVHWPLATLAQQAALILGAAVVASLYPALRASRTPATELTREDF